MTASDVAGPLGLGCLGSWIFWLIVALFGYKVLQIKSGAPYVIGLIITIILVSIIVSVKFSERREEEDRRVQDEVRKWHQMQQVWDDLYYCSCGDIVFRGSDPSKSAPTSVMVGWLAQQ